MAHSPAACHSGGAAGVLKVGLEVLEVSHPSDFEAAFRSAVKAECGGVLMLSSPLFGGNPQLLADLAIQSGLPSINIFPQFAQSGGLLGYGPDLRTLFMQAGVLVRKALMGNTVAELPIERPTKYVLVINLKTAQALGLTIPQSILLRADEVIR